MTEFEKRIEDYLFQDLRYGQSVYNALYDIHPKIAQNISDTDLDTFYTTDEEEVKEKLKRIQTLIDMYANGRLQTAFRTMKQAITGDTDYAKGLRDGIEAALAYMEDRAPVYESDKKGE